MIIYKYYIFIGTLIFIYSLYLYNLYLFILIIFIPILFYFIDKFTKSSYQMPKDSNNHIEKFITEKKKKNPRQIFRHRIWYFTHNYLQWSIRNCLFIFSVDFENTILSYRLYPHKTKKCSTSTMKQKKKKQK